MVYSTVLPPVDKLWTDQISRVDRTATSDEQKRSGTRTSGRHRAISGVDNLWTSGETKLGQNKQNKKRLKKYLTMVI